MYLNREQELASSGELGPSPEWAMRVLCRLGDHHHAARLVPVRSTHIPDWCARKLSELPFDISVADPLLTYTTANPGGTDHGLSLDKMAWENLGVRISYTCTPYLVGNHPNRGEVVAWGGRAASAFVNSVFGARSEVESFDSALASAITGLTPERGLHLEENRQATMAVLVHEVDDLDYSMLGWSLSRVLKGEVPLLCGVRPSFDEAKKLAFTINAIGNMPLFLMQKGIVPPLRLERLDLDMDEIHESIEMEWGFAPDLAIVGCPHLSEQEINWWSKRLADRVNRGMEAWFFTSRLCLDKCPLSGAVLRSVGRVFVDCCPLTMQIELKGRKVACDNPTLAASLISAGVKAHFIPSKFLHELMVTGFRG